MIDGINIMFLLYGLNIVVSSMEIYGLKVVNFDESNNVGIFVDVSF